MSATSSPRLITVGARMGFTFGGAALLIVGGLLDWLGDHAGTDIKYDVLYAGNPGVAKTFAESVGFMAIGLGCVAIIGLAFRGGGLTRLAGALGLVLFVLFTVNVYRNSDLGIRDYQIGVWLVLAGSLVTLSAGFLGGRREVTVVSEPAPAAPEPPEPPLPPAP